MKGDNSYGIKNSIVPKGRKALYDRSSERKISYSEFVCTRKVKTVYSHIDSIITGAAVLLSPLVLTAGDEIRTEYFLQRKEMGIINIGGNGKVIVDGTVYELNYKDGIYIGMGSRDIIGIHNRGFDNGAYKGNDEVGFRSGGAFCFAILMAYRHFGQTLKIAVLLASVIILNQTIILVNMITLTVGIGFISLITSVIYKKVFSNYTEKEAEADSEESAEINQE
ncbi:MAG: hypothetical protein WC900_02190 [Oscillospiraceae bacterium]|jgi:hypothetical protein